MSHGSLKSCFEYYFTYGARDRNGEWNKRNPLFLVINKEIPTIISNRLLETNYSEHRVKGCSGASGKWSDTPYVCVLDANNTFGTRYTTSKGLFPCFLFPKRSSSIYLTLMLGIGSKTTNELNKMCTFIRKQIDCSRYNTDVQTMMIEPDRYNYKNATILFKEYSMNNFPEDDELIEEIKELVGIKNRSLKACGESLQMFILK